MSLSIEVPPPLEAQLRQEAARAGIPTTEFAVAILIKGLATPAIHPLQARLQAELAEYTRNPPSESEVRQSEQELAELKRALNESRQRDGAEPVF